MVNRAIAGNLYPPGSTFKIVTAAAALESKKWTEESVVPGPARLDLPLTTATLPNSNKQPCGADDKTTIKHALEISCNTAFGWLVMELGGEALRQQAAKFGVGDRLGIPMTVTPSSVPADLNKPQQAQSAIGQYEVRMTPLQVAMISAAVANRGVVMKPHLVGSVHSGDLEVIDRTGLSSGTVYPALRRLESGGLIQGDWEEDRDAHGAGRPARRYYRVTALGAEALERLRPAVQYVGLKYDHSAARDGEKIACLNPTSKNTRPIRVSISRTSRLWLFLSTT